MGYNGTTQCQMGISYSLFLTMEPNAQATDCTHFIATNQVGTAGAVGMNGILQLARRISAERDIDFDESQFFSTSDGVYQCPLAESGRQEWGIKLPYKKSIQLLLRR